MKKEYPDILKLEGEKWHNPDPATGKLGTRVPAEWLQTTEDSLKSLTLEMLEVLKAAGINPNELNNTQVRDAIKKIILNNATSTLSDRTDQTATIKAVNDVNRSASTAQKTANNAHALAQTKQDKLTFVGDGPDVMKDGAFGVGGLVDIDYLASGEINNGTSFYFAPYSSEHLPYAAGHHIIDLKRYGWRAQLGFHAFNGSMIVRGGESGKYTKWFSVYTEKNTTPDKSGFLRASGSANAVITTDIATKSKAGITRLDSSLSDAEDRAATPKAVNDVNRAASTAQKTANNAHALAQTKQDKLPFVGDGPEVMKTGAFGVGSVATLRSNANILDIEQYKTGFSWFWALASESRPENRNGFFTVNKISNSFAVIKYTQDGGKSFVNVLINGVWTGWKNEYSEFNTTLDKSGFLRASGSANALIESDVTNSLGNSKSLVASQALVNSVNSKIKLNTASKAQNGWWKCGDTGLIYQWGKGWSLGSDDKTQGTMTFPIAFPNAVLNIQALHGKGTAARCFVVTSFSNQTFNILSDTTSVEIWWLAIGY